MTIKFTNLTLVEGSKIWEELRNVKVSSVDIFHGTMRSKGIHSYTIKPTFENHDFMNKAGYTMYHYEVEITEVKDNEDGTVTLNTGMNELMVEIASDQLDEWKKFATGFIKFYNTDGSECNKFKQEKQNEFNNWFASIGQ